MVRSRPASRRSKHRRPPRRREPRRWSGPRSRSRTAPERAGRFRTPAEVAPRRALPHPSRPGPPARRCQGRPARQRRPSRRAATLRPAAASQRLTARAPRRPAPPAPPPLKAAPRSEVVREGRRGRPPRGRAKRDPALGFAGSRPRPERPHRSADARGDRGLARGAEAGAGRARGGSWSIPAAAARRARPPSGRPVRRPPRPRSRRRAGPGSGAATAASSTPS